MQRLYMVVSRAPVLLTKLHQVNYISKPLRSQQQFCQVSTYYRSLLRRDICPSCLAMHQNFIHSSAILEVTFKNKIRKKHGPKKSNLLRKEERKRENFQKTRPQMKDQLPVVIRENMTLEEIAQTLGTDVYHVFDVLEAMGVNVWRKKSSFSQVINRVSDIHEICRLSGRRAVIEAKKVEKVVEDKDVIKQPPPDPETLTKRPPVVTIMGHVDHGKTTLLDALRHSNIVEKEFGGITQHIGAFSVKLKSGDTITFLDTPGHAAFATMRSRGAQVTDIVVLVVAADDGVMEQTLESVKFATEAKVPIIVAINKCDKPDADVEVTKRGLLSIALTPEDMGGDVQCIEISALKRLNLDALQDAIVVQSEVMELKGDQHGLVEGVIIESKIDQGKGKVSTALIQRGTAKKGSVLVSGTAMAKVRRLLDENGKTVQVAGPGQAVEIIGWRELPHPGDHINEVASEGRAREIVKWREERRNEQKIEEGRAEIERKVQAHDANYKARRQERLDAGFKISKLFASERRFSEAVQAIMGPELCIVIRGDVDGSVEAIINVLSTYDNRQCHLSIINYDVGIVTEQDVENIAPFKGIIYAFNTKTPPSVIQLAHSRNVQIKEHNVIYRLIDDIREELTQRLEPVEEEVVIGEANVIQSFSITTKRRVKVPVAGCRCTSGVLNKKKEFKLVRDGETVVTGKIQSLKHQKNEVETIKKEVECGIMFEDTSIEPQAHDVIICYELVSKPQQLEWDLHF